MKIRAIYPGTFDPLTLGHIDVIQRATNLFDELIVAVSESNKKEPFIPLEERVEILKDSIKDFHNAKVFRFNKLLVDFCLEQDVYIIVRGLRAISDFDYEYHMALTNRSLQNKVETIFVMASEQFSHVSSSMIREIYHLGGDVARFLPDAAKEYLKAQKNE